MREVYFPKNYKTLAAIYEEPSGTPRLRNYLHIYYGRFGKSKLSKTTPPSQPQKHQEVAGLTPYHSYQSNLRYNNLQNMRKVQDEINYFFVDESGDPTFYDGQGQLIIGREGISPILILGFIKTQNPKSIRSTLENLRKQIENDTYLRGIPSLKKSLISFHAKDDSAEVKERVYKTIVNLDFTAELFVARKIQNIFNKRHHRDENEFYDDLTSKLFENKLHLSQQNEIYFAVRGNKTRQIPLEQAIEEAIKTFETKWNKKIDSKINIYPQSPSGEPCLQVIDYINWAVQRAFIKKDMRFYSFIEKKIKYLVDIYDTKNYPKNFYSGKNKFDINKISPL